MRVLMTGGTGLIGRAFCQKALEKKWKLTLTTRKPPKNPLPDVEYVIWKGDKIDPQSVGPADAVINLAGCGIADHRWTAEYKKQILTSRVNSTRACVDYIREHESRFGFKPQVFISASAVGYYGTHRDAPVVETDGPGKDFLSQVGVEWEAAAQGAGVRTVIMRTGVVLAREGGAFPRLLKPFKFYAGGYIGSGKQGFPWVHID
ncbi:MAG: NAD-dependent epimerase/dehydratase family protein, partial [Bacteroidia bacterium]|nr:NAD-dependent epimerase/dehydratase family protein [Bacteroidia bacterium]MDW8333986.1 NAD-dependent epimerase/dehydratase family protein [Bacteroidia bacterium]